MNTEWRDFLEQQGAQIESEQVTGFDNGGDISTLAEKTIIADLSHFSLIKVSGEEAMDFLQNQFSNDIKDVTEQQSQLSAYCSPKGRILASFRIFKQADDYYLELSADLLEPTLKRLRMFVMRSKVVLDDVSNDWARIGLAGQQAESLLQPHFSTIPAEPHQSVSEKGASLIRLAGDIPRFEIHGMPSTLITIWSDLQSQAQTAGRAVWDWFDIKAGIPVINAKTVEAFVPQMVNFSTIGGVSFTKGCYPGQEVVARMHYLGKLKRRMYLAHVESDSPPDAGMELYTQTDADGEPQSCGKIVQAQPSPAGGFDLLAVLQIAHATNPIQLGETGPEITISDDPYPVSNEA
ncbi:MAG: folate-binding protein YgfZ [Gammaproteobacteria bacterium]|nr:folate-binding protein YgfZ [Gammaproteobacteria bacterium]